MDTHLSTEEIKGYLARTVTKNDFKTVGEHVHSCETCYQAFLSKLQDRFPIVIDLDELAGMQGWHLEGEELAAYVEGRSEELDFECASLHLEECNSCMQMVSAAFEHTLEYPRPTKIDLSRPSFLWNRDLRGFHSIALPRLRLAAAVVVLVALALIAWAVLQSPTEKSRLAGAQPPKTISPDPSLQPPVPVQPGPGAGPDNGHGVDKRTPTQLSATASERHGVGGQQDDVERDLIAKDLAMPLAIEMLDRTPAVVIRGNRASIQSFTVVRPFTTLIGSDRPTFSWTTLKGATSYTVSVYDADLHLVRTSEPLTETRWLMPDRLKAGIVYTWTVDALKDGKEIVAPALPARAEFKILGKAELYKLKLRVNRTTSHVARGVLYAEAGMLDEAEKEFQTHLDLRPSDEPVRKLLQVVQSWRIAN